MQGRAVRARSFLSTVWGGAQYAPVFYTKVIVYPTES